MKKINNYNQRMMEPFFVWQDKILCKESITTLLMLGPKFKELIQVTYYSYQIKTQNVKL